LHLLESKTAHRSLQFSFRIHESYHIMSSPSCSWWQTSRLQYNIFPSGSFFFFCAVEVRTLYLFSFFFSIDDINFIADDLRSSRIKTIWAVQNTFVITFRFYYYRSFRTSHSNRTKRNIRRPATHVPYADVCLHVIVIIEQVVLRKCWILGKRVVAIFRV
jgi:hypothetical protein